MNIPTKEELAEVVLFIHQENIRVCNKHYLINLSKCLNQNINFSQSNYVINLENVHFHYEFYDLPFKLKLCWLWYITILGKPFVILNKGDSNE